MSTWNQMIKEVLKPRETIIAIAVSDGDRVHFWEKGKPKNQIIEDLLNLPFDAGYGRENGLPFTAWSKTRVFFPICYDGAEWVGSAPRNPKRLALNHQGG